MNPREDLTSTAEFCRNFPIRPIQKISRENLYEHVDTVLKDVTRIVCLEGDELSGKTEFLAGYMERHPTATVGIFLTPGDSYFYTPEYLKLVIAEQIHWIIEGKSANFDSIDSATFQKLLHKAQRFSRQSSITFVIDGLAEPNTPDHAFQSEMLETFPFGQREFRFLISGSSSLFESLNLSRYKPKPVSLIPISQEDAATYFQDFSELKPKDIHDIRRFCRGSIGSLAKFRNLLETGSSLEEIFSNKEGGLSNLLEMGWELDSKVAGLQDLLSFIVFSNRILNIQQLSGLASQDANHVRNLLSSCRFIEVDSEKSIVSIRSAVEKNFLQIKLSLREKEVQQRVVSDLLKNPDGVDATRYLPVQLMAIGQYDDLIQRLNNDHFVKLLESERSLGALRRHSDIGLAASTKNKDEFSRFRFGLSSSAVSGLTLSTGVRRKIEAIIKLGDAEGAIELASQAPTKEERLKLLGATARALHQNRLPISAELKRQTKQLVEEVDIEALGLMATDIACDILVVDFGLAIEFFQKSQKSLEKTHDEGRHGSTDPGQQRNADKEDKEQALGEVHIRPNERHSQRFANAVAALVERASANRMLTSGSDLEPKHELLALKQWIKKRRKDPDAWKVADHALDVALKDLSRAPRVEDFRSIATVLPYILDIQIAERLLKRIEAQLGTQLTLGTSEESVRLEMLLERVRHRISPAECELSLITIYTKVEQIEDISVKAACLAWMLYSLQQFPDPIELESRTTLISETTKKLVESIEVLLASSADHFQAAQGAIYALARADTDLAFELISQLNTQSRRDKGYTTLAYELVSSQAHERSAAPLLKCFSLIKNELHRSTTILRCLNEISRDCEYGIAKSCHDGILGLWKNLRAANYRFIAAAHSYRIVMSTTKDAQREEYLRQALEEIWPQIMVDWVRIDLGYMLVRDISKVNEPLARQWLQRIEPPRVSWRPVSLS